MEHTVRVAWIAGGFSLVTALLTLAGTLGAASIGLFKPSEKQIYDSEPYRKLVQVLEERVNEARAESKDKDRMIRERDAEIRTKEGEIRRLLSAGQRPIVNPKIPKEPFEASPTAPPVDLKEPGANTASRGSFVAGNYSDPALFTHRGVTTMDACALLCIANTNCKVASFADSTASGGWANSCTLRATSTRPIKGQRGLYSWVRELQ